MPGRRHTDTAQPEPDQPSARTAKADSDSGSIRAVTRALSILGVLRPEGMTLTMFAEETGLAVPTVHRFLRTLESSGYVVRQPNGDFIPGPGIVRLALSVGPWGPVHAILREALEQLSTRFDETTAFFIRDGSRRVCTESVQSTLVVRAAYAPGMSGPIHLEASGKILVAFGRTEEILGQVSDDDAFCSTNRPQKRTLADLRKELDDIRETRLAFSQEEELADVWSVASPILVGDILLGAISVLVPVSRATELRQRELAAATLELANELTGFRLRLSPLETVRFSQLGESGRWHNLFPPANRSAKPLDKRGT